MYWNNPSEGHQGHFFLKHMMYEVRLKDFGFLNVKKRKLRGDYMVVVSYVIKGNREDKIFSKVQSKRTRGNRCTK